ncbi:MAG: hypothetical protein ACXVC6_01540 [Bacteroidia bacterium]
MKKVTLFAVVAVAALSLASCKKDHTCTCTDSTTYSGYTVVTTTKAKSTKKDAAAWCTGVTTTATSGGTSVSGYTRGTCVVS